MWPRMSRLAWRLCRRGRCGTGGVDVFRTCAIPSAVCASSQRVGQDLWALRRAASAFAVAVLKVGA